MEAEEHQQTTVTMTTTMMNTTHTASKVDTISEQPVVVVVVSDDDEDTNTDTDTDTDADKDVPRKATTVLVSSTHLSSSSSSSIVLSQRRRKGKHRQRREVIKVVRFKKEEEEAQDKGVQEKATKWKGKKMSSGNSKHNSKTPSASWYTSQEMKENYKSLSRSSIIMEGTDDEQGRTQQQQQQQQCPTTSMTVSWFSSEKRMQRRRRRKQMYKIMQAIQDYEVATHTKVPELLSQLLARHSQPMVAEGLRIAVVASAHSTTDDTIVC